MATVRGSFKPMIGTKSSFENIKSNYKDLVQIEEIWMDRDTGGTFFIIKEDNIDFSNNILYNNSIKEEEIFSNENDFILPF